LGPAVDLVNGVHAGAAQLAVLPGMDHYLWHADSQAQSMERSRNHGFGEYYANFSSTIGDWICARARCTA
jgi:hypothetical protein